MRENKVSVLARLTHPDAGRKALRHASRTNPVRRRPPIDMVRRAAKKLGGLRTGSSHS